MQSKHIVYKFYRLFRSELNSRHRFHLHGDSEREDLLFSILPPSSTSPLSVWRLRHQVTSSLVEIVSLFCCNCWIYLSEYFTKLQVVNFTSITSSNSSTSRTVVSLLSSPYIELVLNNGTRPPLSKISENYRMNYLYFILYISFSTIGQFRILCPFRH